MVRVGGSYGFLWAVAEWTQQLDELRSRWTFRGEIRDIFVAALILAVSVFSILFLVHAPDVSRLFLIALFSSQVFFAIAQRTLLRSLLGGARRRGLGAQNVIVLGTGRRAVDLVEPSGAPSRIRIPRARIPRTSVHLASGTAGTAR